MIDADDEATLNSFTNPDKEPPPEYTFDEEFQRNILALLLSDRIFLVKSMHLIKPEYFTNEVHRLVCSTLFKYFEKYKSLPSKNHVAQELREALAEKKAEIRLGYLAETNTVYEYYIPGLESRDYLQDKVTNFAKFLALKNAFNKSMDEIKKHPDSESTWAKVHSIIKEALTIEQNFEIGLDYFQTVEERYIRMQEKIEKGDVFTSGFLSIDSAIPGGGIGRGEIASFMGLPGTGKSLALVGLTVANLHRGKKVLYISTEMDQDAVATRFDAQLGDPTEENDVSINNLFDKKDFVIKALQDYVSDLDDKRQLIIKQFPSGMMDVPIFRAYYTQLVLYGFKPDLVIIDYVGEMKDYPNMPTHESRFRIVRDLRGFAVEEKFGCFVAMQPNKQAKELVKLGDFIDDDSLADSFAQSRPLDAFWSINQFQDEKECGLARMWICKHRNGRSKFWFPVEYNKKSLRITEISMNAYNDRLRLHRSEKEERSTDDTRERVRKPVGNRKQEDIEKAAQAIIGGDVSGNNELV